MACLHQGVRVFALPLSKILFVLASRAEAPGKRARDEWDEEYDRGRVKKTRDRSAGGSGAWEALGTAGAHRSAWAGRRASQGRGPRGSRGRGPGRGGPGRGGPPGGRGRGSGPRGGWGRGRHGGRSAGGRRGR